MINGCNSNYIIREGVRIIILGSIAKVCYSHSRYMNSNLSMHTDHVF